MKISATQWPLLKNPVLFPPRLSMQCNLDSRFPFFMHYFPFAQYVQKYVKHFGYVELCPSNIFLVLGSFAERFDASALSAVIRKWSLRRARLCIHQKTHFLILEKKYLEWFLADWLFLEKSISHLNLQVRAVLLVQSVLFQAH